MFYSSTWILINADNCANIFSMVTIGFYILVGMMGGCFSARICFIDREIIMKMELGFNKFCCWLLRWTNKFTVVVFSLWFIKCVNIGVNNFGCWLLKWRCRFTFFNVVFIVFFLLSPIEGIDRICCIAPKTVTTIARFFINLFHSLCSLMRYAMMVSKVWGTCPINKSKIELIELAK